MKKSLSLIRPALSRASRFSSLPLLRRFSPSACEPLEETDRRGFLKCQRLAFEAVTEVASHLKEGCTERRAADLIQAYLRDCEVTNFFHHPFVWFGDRTRFAGIRNYREYQPTSRVLREGEVYILDVAPIFNGYTCDIGYTGSLGRNKELERAMAFLAELKIKIPQLFSSGISGAEIWKQIDQMIQDAGYDNVHQQYPFSVLGHRIHRNTPGGPGLSFLHFGWQSYWSLLSRGLWGQLLNSDFDGDLTGLWAIEPHIGAPGFGAKFEEILVVEGGTAQWLERYEPAIETRPLIHSQPETGPKMEKDQNEI